MTDDDRTYYQERAEREMELARQARHPEAARAHSVLAGHYLDMVHNGVVRPFRAPRSGLRLLVGSQ